MALPTTNMVFATAGDAINEPFNVPSAVETLSGQFYQEDVYRKWLTL